VAIIPTKTSNTSVRLRNLLLLFLEIFFLGFVFRQNQTSWLDAPSRWSQLALFDFANTWSKPSTIRPKS